MGPTMCITYMSNTKHNPRCEHAPIGKYWNRVKQPLKKRAWKYRKPPAKMRKNARGSLSQETGIQNIIDLR